MKTVQKSNERFGIWLIVIICMLIGAAIRLIFILPANFPLNDGGLFYAMTRDLQLNNYQIPNFTSYNGHNIPFAYPPLSFYITGLISDSLSLDLLKIFHFFPFIINIVTIPAFFLLSNEYHQVKTKAIHSTIAFALVPPAFEWLIMGGGITRAPAYFFSILALFLTLHTIRNPRWYNIALMPIFTGLTGYFHIEMLWNTAFIIIYFILYLSRNRFGGKLLIITGLGAFLILAPYWHKIIRSHGLNIFLNALSSGQFEWAKSLGKILLDSVTGEFIFTPILVFAIIAIAYCIQSKQFFLPIWVLIIIVINPRSLERSLMLPICLLAGIAIEDIIAKGFTKTNDKPKVQQKDMLFQSPILAIMISYILIRSAVGSIIHTYEKHTLDPVSLQDQKAMEWISQSTPETSSFLVLTDYTGWETNKVMEWFPVLAQRQSILTVQGTEWLEVGTFNMHRELYESYNECTNFYCVKRLLENHNINFTYVYVSGFPQDNKDKVSVQLKYIEQLNKSKDFQLIYEIASIKVYKYIE